MRRLADVFSPDVSVEAQGEKQQGREISCQNTRSELRQLMPLTDCCHGENGEDASPARPTNRGVPSDDRPMATRVLARLIFCIVSLAERVGEAAALFFRGRSTLRNYGREARYVPPPRRDVRLDARSAAERETGCRFQIRIYINTCAKDERVAIFGAANYCALIIRRDDTSRC